MPTDIEKILELIAMWAKGYDNHMKWSEEAKLRSDMMRHTDRWRLVSTQQIRDKCHDLGMRAKDVETICDMHSRRLQGHRLLPQRSYKGFEFRHENLRTSEVE